MDFIDRLDAGRQLGVRLREQKHAGVVLGLARGGVPVAFEVASALGVPLEVIMVRKLGVPWQPELAMGALGEDGVRVVNDDLVRVVGIRPEALAAVEVRERAELAARSRRYRGDRQRISIKGCPVIIVDDGVATGSSALAACAVARAGGATNIVFATPVAPPDVAAQLRRVADAVVCLQMPVHFVAVAHCYRDFSQTSDEEVMALLDRAAAHRLGSPSDTPQQRIP